MRARLAFLGASALILLLVWKGAATLEAPRRETEYEPLGSVELIAATDLHYLAPELTDHGAYFQTVMEHADGKAMEYCEEITGAFVEQVIAQAPDGVILSGDLTFNGARRSHEALAEKLRRIRDAGIPVFVLPGNHDLENPMAAAFQGDGYTREESVTARQFEEIYQAFGYQDALARDGSSLSYMVRLAPKLRLLLVDVNTAEVPGAVTGDTLAWVEEQLASARQEGILVIAVSHQNLLQHNPVFAEGYVMDGNGGLLALFEKYGVICHLSGHLHVQHTARSAGGLPEIVTGSLLVFPLHYGVLRLDSTAGTYQARQVETPGEISSYAESFFWETAYRQAVASLAGHAGAEAMAAYFADVNTAYFAGRMDTISYDTAQLREWKRQNTFLAVYLQSLAGDAGKDHTTVSFDF